MVLALSTSHAGDDTALPAVVEAMRPLGARAVALHREPGPEELAGLARYARKLSFVAVFGRRALPGAERLVLVVDGRPAGPERERSLEDFCRELHGLRGRAPAVALRAAGADGAHPAPGELPLIREALPWLGYWHDPARAGEEHLDAAGAMLRGASFHPLTDVDLAGLREALPGGAPAVVACPAGTGDEELREAWACARGVFGA